MSKKAVKYIAVCLVLIIIAAFAATVIFKVKADMKENAAQSIKNSVISSAVQCYAIEAAYPPGISYLKENYGLVYNEKKYLVSYNIFASNILPDVQVIEIQ